jgi:hypothetical protein
MQAMTFPEKPLEWRALAVAVVVSLAIHGLILFVNYQKPTRHGNSLPRIEASLARQPAPVALPPPAPALPDATQKTSQAAKQAASPTASDGDSATVAVNRPERAKMDGRRKGGNE